MPYYKIPIAVKFVFEFFYLSVIIKNNILVQILHTQDIFALYSLPLSVIEWYMMLSYEDLKE